MATSRPRRMPGRHGHEFAGVTVPAIPILSGFIRRYPSRYRRGRESIATGRPQKTVVEERKSADTLASGKLHLRGRIGKGSCKRQSQVDRQIILDASSTSPGKTPGPRWYPLRPAHTQEMKAVDHVFDRAGETPSIQIFEGEPTKLDVNAASLCEPLPVPAAATRSVMVCMRNRTRS